MLPFKELSPGKYHDSSGMIGTSLKVRVRGTSTVIGNASPVWVIDGIIQEDPLPFAGAQLNDILSSGDLSSSMASYFRE